MVVVAVVLVVAVVVVAVAVEVVLVVISVPGCPLAAPTVGFCFFHTTSK